MSESTEIQSRKNTELKNNGENSLKQNWINNTENCGTLS